jgi:sulfopyruvate decarboxylase TPP-binding subunit
MGQAVDAVLEAMGILIFRVDSEDDLEVATKAALSACFSAGQGVALILSQRFLGAKAF